MKRLHTATLCLVLLSGSVARAEPAKLNLLLLTGQNNHAWQQTTPALTQALESSGRFKVDVTEHPEACTAESLAPYDVLLSNWNAWGDDVAVKEWPEATRSAMLDFVRNGKGLAIIHAGSSSFYGWKEYHQMVGAAWDLGRTGHGSPHQFYVWVTDPGHPITHGMKLFLTRDELWHRTGVQPGVTALATAFSAPETGGSGQQEPLVLANDFGKGRCFNLVLGHDARAMASAGFRSLLCRGTEWAATGEVTIPVGDLSLSDEELDFVLSQLRTYRPADRHEVLLALEYHLGCVANTDRAAAAAQRLLAFVADTQAALDGRQFALRQLSLVGSAGSVQALAALLTDKDLGLYARFALERIQGDEASAAMRAALQAASGMQRVGLLNALGARRDEQAVSLLAGLTNDADISTATAALAALGRVGTAEALQALSASEAAMPAVLRPAHTRALLRCAEGLLAKKQAGTAKPVYAKLLIAAQPDCMRAAAFVGLAACENAKRGEFVAGAMNGDDKVLRDAAVRVLRDSDDGSLLRSAAERLESLPPEVQAPVIALLQARGEAASLPVVAKAAASGAAAVRRAALIALSTLGDASSVAVLAEAAGSADPTERNLATEALSCLPGETTETAIVAALGKSAPAAQRQLIRALGSRSARAAVPALLALAESKAEAEVRAEALDAVGQLGDATVCERLLPMLAGATDGDRGPLEQALVALCSRTGTTKPVAAALPGAADPCKISLIAVLGSVGGADALEAVRAAAKAPAGEVRSAAIKALSGWADAGPLDDLLTVATETKDATLKVLALRGVARLVPLAGGRSPEVLLRFVTTAMGATDRPDEKKALLSALGSLPSLPAMNSAQEYQKDPVLADEAALAALQIADRIFRQHLTETEALARQQQDSPTPALRERAVALLLKISKADNLAFGATATSPDGIDKDGAASGDQAAIDDDPATYWDEADGQKLYVLRVQLQQPAKVSVIRILGYQQHSYAPKDFEVVCDDKVVKKVEGAQYQDNLLTVALPETECTIVELRITGYYGQSPAIRELGIFSRAPGAKRG